MSERKSQMYKAMPTMPVSDLRNNQPAILAQLDQTPVLLTQRGHSTAVLVNLQTWNRMVEELEHLRFMERMRQGAAEIERGEFVTFEELQQGWRERGLLDA